jgi:hypothetical protein
MELGHPPDRLIAIGAASSTLTAPATGTLLARAGFVDLERAAFPILAIQGQDGGLGPFLGVHGGEGEATRPPGNFVHDDIDLVHRTVF